MNDIYGNIDLVYEGLTIGYKISVGIDLKNGYKLYMPSLTFTKRTGMIDEETIESWDNDIYLIDTLYDEVIVPWVTNRSTPNAKHFVDLTSIKGMDIEDMPGLKRLFDAAIMQGFFERRKHITLIEAEHGNRETDKSS